MDLRQLRYFVAIAEAGNLTRAAARVHVTQPSLSQAMRELEEEIGCDLFVRRARGVELTDGGRALVLHAREILQRALEAPAAARSAAAGEGGELVVGFTGSSVFGVLPGLIGRFRARHPAVTVSLREMLTDVQLESLREHRIDVGLSRPAAGEPGIASRTIARLPFVVALPVRHPLASQRSVALKALADLPLILPQRRRGPGFYTQLMTLLNRAGVVPRVVHEAAHMPTMVGMVGAGLGIAVVSAELANLEVRDVIYRPLEGGEGVDLALIWRRGDSSRTLADFLRCADADSTNPGGPPVRHA
jgi:DNA-binding transcriptional LysR family regulator